MKLRRARCHLHHIRSTSDSLDTSFWKDVECEAVRSSDPEGSLRLSHNRDVSAYPTFTPGAYRICVKHWRSIECER
jgi:hypothetical protein